MLQTTSSWEFKAIAGSVERKGSTGRIAKDKVQVFKLDSDEFVNIINEYPYFRRFVLMRANLRRMNWIKIFEENRH